MQLAEPAPAKLNLALHVRGKLPDGRHRIETIFAFCTDGDRSAAAESDGLSLAVNGPIRERSWSRRGQSGIAGARPRFGSARASREGAELILTKNLPGRFGDRRRIGGRGGGASAADAALGHRSGPCDGDRADARSRRSCLSPQHDRRAATGRATNFSSSTLASAASPSCSSIRASSCRLRTCFRAGAGWTRVRSATGAQGATISKSRRSSMVPLIGTVLAWLSAQQGANFVRMSGQRRDLLRPVRQRGGARPGRNCSSSGMVAAGDLSALTALQ